MVQLGAGVIIMTMGTIMGTDYYNYDGNGNTYENDDTQTIDLITVKKVLMSDDLLALLKIKASCPS